ncbi:tetratricopeptide repeat protein [Mobilicoccus pelagius]|uniref:Uncharacterized protein n=1 Tax=Mobilicoccus pelagius NBRC 104925 TaxID=1089455 RepID=H5US90_9MICO|nr:tetratricopeptide repeat protein [Mobilicoccus pelagius]GAB48598.1 hypothetical protein MOPEL_074_00850 [Mobilicoccus pelagius NBRC 104925]
MTRDPSATRAWLGLDADADETDVARTREALDAFLADAPPDLDGWARGQRTAAFTHTAAPATAPASGARSAPVPSGTNPRRRRSPLVPLGIAAALALVVVGVYNMGDTTDPATAGTAGQAASSAPADPHANGMPTEMPTQPSLDQAKVDRLTKKIAAEPKNTAAMKELANEYSRAGHYRKAAETQTRIVELNPDDVDARLALGVAHFNMDDLPAAEKHWNEVLRRDPDNANAYYDLGFLYFATNPPKLDKAEAAWKKLVEIDPDSDLAKSVESHLDRFKSGAAAGGGGTSPTHVPTPSATKG